MPARRRAERQGSQLSACGQRSSRSVSRRCGEESGTLRHFNGAGSSGVGCRLCGSLRPAAANAERWPHRLAFAVRSTACDRRTPSEPRVGLSGLYPAGRQFSCRSKSRSLTGSSRRGVQGDRSPWKGADGDLEITAGPPAGPALPATRASGSPPSGRRRR